MNKKLLITGASSFIGSFLVEEAISKGYEVYAGIRKTSSRQFLQHPNIEFIEMDLSSRKSMEIQLEEFSRDHGAFDFVIHNAGLTYAKNREDFYNVNFQGTKNLVEAILASQMAIKKFVLISSLAAYGPGHEADFTPIQISDQRCPASTYGKSKLMAEQFLRSLNGFPFLIINSTAVYGPRDKDFLRFISLINKGIEPSIGRSTQMISLIYVKDMARAVIRLLSTPFVKRSYIVSDGIAYDKKELGKTSRKILNRKTLQFNVPLKPMRFFVSLLENVYENFGTMPFINKEKLKEISSTNWLCDSQEFWNDIQDKPAYNLESGISETITWYKANNWL